MLSVTLPDGRPLRLSYEGPTGNWIAQLGGADGRSVAGRWLLAVLGELLDLPHGRKPAWIVDVVKEVTGQDTPVGTALRLSMLRLPHAHAATHWNLRDLPSVSLGGR
jgi:hypothetical protein